MTPLDTSQTAKDVQLHVLRSMSGADRLRAALELSECAQKLAFARIAHATPGLTKPQLIREFLRSVLSRDDYARVLT